MSSPSMLRVAAAQYSVDYLTSLDQLREKLARWVAEAAAQGAKLLVFPEFSGMEIAALGDLSRFRPAFAGPAHGRTFAAPCSPP
jgi:predicted amidohydrolase